MRYVANLCILNVGCSIVMYGMPKFQDPRMRMHMRISKDGDPRMRMRMRIFCNIDKYHELLINMICNSAVTEYRLQNTNNADHCN